MIRRVFAAQGRHGFHGEILVEFNVDSEEMRVAVKPDGWTSFGPPVPQLRSEDDREPLALTVCRVPEGKGKAWTPCGMYRPCPKHEKQTCG